MTLEVSKLDKFNKVKLLHSLNLDSNSNAEDKSKFEISNDIKELQLENINEKFLIYNN